MNSRRVTTQVQTKFTLSEMAQIALGSDNLNNDNIHILHTLLDIILKKLGCQNEAVYVKGLDASCMERIFKDAKYSPIPVNDEEVDILTHRLEDLECWEQRIKILESKLECHFDQIKKQYEAVEDEKWMGRFWEFYALPIEDLCTTCEPENEIACSLLNNKYFMMKLLRRIAYPMVERIFALEKKIYELYKKFTEFLKQMEEVLAKLKLLEQMIIEIEKIKSDAEQRYKEFIATMEECQQMLDAKFDKVHVPALKKYLKEKFEEINAALEALKKANDCPRAAGIIMENIKCLSCLNKEVCANIEPAFYLAPDMKSDFKKPPKCRCTEKPEPQLPSWIIATPPVPTEKEEKLPKRRYPNVCGEKSLKSQFLEKVDQKWLDENLKSKELE